MTTSGVVAGRDGALVIDPGILPGEIEAMRWYVEQSGKPAKYLVYTHHHWDHLLGGQAFPAARRLAHQHFPDAMEANRPLDEVRRFDDEYYIEREPPFEFQPPHELIEDGWMGDLGDVAFKLIHLPGHAADMLGVHIPADKTLFASDMLSDVELAMIEGDGDDYIASLHKVDALVTSGQVETLVPGHGHITRDPDTIRLRFIYDYKYIVRLQHTIRGKLNEGADEDAIIEACRSIVDLDQYAGPSLIKTHETNVREVYRAMKEQRRGSR